MILKFLLSTLFLVSFADGNQKIEDFLEDKFSENPNIISLDVTVTDTIKIPDMKAWKAVVVTLDATVKSNKKESKVKQKMIWFTDGTVITKELTSLETGKSLRDSVSPEFSAKYYKKENLLYGNADAKHKVVIFSDPLCPFCRGFVPEAIEYMRKSPKKFAVYYFHFPLPNLHPAAVELSQAAVAAELAGVKDVVLKMYKVKVDAKERNVSKILRAFNKTVGSNVRASDLNSYAVRKHFKSDLDIADEVMVQGTPTIFFDGKLDRQKQKYKNVK